ncbi:hypothetical protein BEWA_035440 [Theileria equi strain WA]|uniref:Signal peptide containing protein n=1 Tax=Theileria equi strain WA TaxID=1537102 RepID=L1LEB2_THEEQ|nr:hypothetical protein BEWA_035440 [Theileria equi strain WA]EKX73508.1 hypothetical protein BEWA_035440 [Theileria equi strain WA]|eukprot:XP_004832960.1 hypothetical protein BEWA_035440 [Theileria equi strain WA]
MDSMPDKKVTTKPTTPITLNLVNPDESNIDVHIKNESEVSFKGYTPKNCYHISSVMNADKELWKATEGADEKCLLAESYAKNNVELLSLKASDNSGTKSKYFEKTGGVWKNIGKELFNEKIDVMIGESGRDASLNIAHPNRLLYKSFDHLFYATSIKLTVPKEGVTVTKVADGSEDIYTLSSGETFEYAKAYLNKDGQPELVLVVAKMSGGVKETYLELKDGVWVDCKDKDAKMRSLVSTAEWVSNFDINLSASKDTDKCTIFEAVVLGVTTKHFYPKPGHVAKKVKYDGQEVWSGGFNDRCLSCIIRKRGDMELLEMIVVEASSRRYRYFENGTEWRSITTAEFYGKLQIYKYKN